ncbi:MAG: TetR/AcrR family transcriptional regulator [Acidimicrobiales bacterium]
MMVGRGRRPGPVDTRADIVRAARAVFGFHGYAGASLRAIARHAGVDPALVHHYFADKADLYVEAMDLPLDPKTVKPAVNADGFSGERLVEHFLAQWEQGPGPGSPAFVSLVQAMVASPEVADSVRDFVIERIGLHGPPGEDDGTRMRRRSLVSSQLLGIAWTRYIMRMEPMASASRAEVARWAGANIDHYAGGRLDEGSS